MSYRCQICHRNTLPNQPMLKHVIYHQVMGLKQIQRELATCGSCHGALQDGVTLADLLRNPSESRRVDSSEDEELARLMSPQSGRTKQLRREPVPSEENGEEPERKKNKRRKKKEEPVEDALKCEICGQLIGDDGQITKEGVLCAEHLPRTKNSK